jgi:hypothetical protein
MTYLKHEQKGRTKKTEPEHKQPTPRRERTGGPSDYGRFFWCVKTKMSESGEIYVMADEVHYTPTGGVLFLGRSVNDSTQDPLTTNLALAPGQWSAVYAASCFDGSAIAVEHWKGEIQR